MFKLILSYIVGIFYTRVKTKILGDTVKHRRRSFMYHKKIINSERTHKCIKELLLSDKPIMIARFGFTEIKIIGDYLMKKNNLKKKYSYAFDNLYNTAGFFSSQGSRLTTDVDKFAELMINSTKDLDLIGVSFALYEDYVLKTYAQNSLMTEFDSLKIMAEYESWGKALIGKKVLVVHPFTKSIEKQYANRKNIWENPNILPEFKLLTYKAIQTIAGNNINRYEDWFAALEIMITDIKKIDFDIALVGCGAYGFPLASAIKRMGKKAFHLGGQTQLVFGILGSRWENVPYYQRFINEYWIHPLESETPKNHKQVENGAYW